MPESTDDVDGSFLEDFDAPELDVTTWVPSYLPMWSSRAASGASFSLTGSELVLDVPVDHPVWCEDDHRPPIRVSGIQSGVHSGPVGSTVGQQPFRPGQQVREAQSPLRGWTPEGGLLEVRCRMDLSPRSMAAAWMVGVEDRPERSGEICLVEVFGDALGRPDRPGGASADVGQGIHPFRDPALREDFAAPRLALDVTTPHTYAAHWRRGRVDFLVDGVLVRTSEQAPAYAMQLMLAVFDFPEHPDAAAWAGHVPALVVEHVRGGPLPG